MSGRSKVHLAQAFMAVVMVFSLIGTPVADPTILNMPPVFCFRITDIVADKSDPEGNRFTFLFESLNWSNQEAFEIYISVNQGTGFGGASGAPFFAGAAIDGNGRQIGPGSDPPPGNVNNANDWSVISFSPTAIRWQSGSPISPQDLIGAASGERNPCNLVPGCQSETDNQGNVVSVIPNPETVDDGPNVLDGFQFTVDDFDPGEIFSFNWKLLDHSGQPIGTAGFGNSYGFGTVNLAHTNGGTLPGPVFTGNTGFSQSPNLFYDEVYIVPDPAIMGAEFGPSITAAFLNPSDNIFNEPINTSLMPASQADAFANSEVDMLLALPNGAQETLTLTGPSTIHFVVGPNGQAVKLDNNDFDDAVTILEQLELTGRTSANELVTLRLRPTTKRPFLRSHGQTEENSRNVPGILELPPFTASGSAESYIDVALEIAIGGQLLHNNHPVHIETTLDHKPPQAGESYASSDGSELYDEDDNPAGFRLLQFIYTPVSSSLAASVEIISPAQDTSLCAGQITVIAALTVSGGNPPYTDTTCTINGIPSTIQPDGTFMATVPLVPGQNKIIAQATVFDATINALAKASTRRFEDAVGIDSVFVLSDPTPAITNLNFDNLPVISGEILDPESGIAEVEVIEATNRVVTIDPFTVGDKRVTFSSDKLDINKRSSFMLRVTNVAGCESIVDPVYVKITAARGVYDLSFNLLQTDRYLFVKNDGLQKIRFLINGQGVTLEANASGRGSEGNLHFMPAFGLRSIDLTPFMRQGENFVDIVCTGAAEAAAELLFSDIQVADGVATGTADGNTAESLLPATFALGANFPNPFNPETAISFEVPAGWTAPVTLRIFNVQGQLIQTLVEGVMPPGKHNVRWNGKDTQGQQVATGMYLYQIVSADYHAVRKMLMAK